MASDPLLPIGKVVKAHGLKGHLKVIPYGEALATLTAGDKVTARLPDGSTQPLTVAEIRPYRRGFLFLSLELNTREQAGILAGAELCVSESRLLPSAADEFYWYQLIGLEVVTGDGRKLGKIEEIFPTGSNDVFVVRQGHKEILVPATHQVVRQVDLRRRLMIVDLPETL